MEPELHHHLSIMSTSTTKVMGWIRHLSSFLPSNDAQSSLTPQPLPPPAGSPSKSLRDAYATSCAWFVGPKAENAQYLKRYVDTILNDLVQCRRNFSREDEVSRKSSSSKYDDHDHHIGYPGLHLRRSGGFSSIQEQYGNARNQRHISFSAAPATLCPILFPSIHGTYGE